MDLCDRAAETNIRLVKPNLHADKMMKDEEDGGAEEDH